MKIYVARLYNPDGSITDERAFAKVADARSVIKGHKKASRKDDDMFSELETIVLPKLPKRELALGLYNRVLDVEATLAFCNGRPVKEDV